MKLAQMRPLMLKEQAFELMRIGKDHIKTLIKITLTDHRFIDQQQMPAQKERLIFMH